MPSGHRVPSSPASSPWAGAFRRVARHAGPSARRGPTVPPWRLARGRGRCSRTQPSLPPASRTYGVAAAAARRRRRATSVLSERPPANPAVAVGSGLSREGRGEAPCRRAGPRYGDAWRTVPKWAVVCYPDRAPAREPHAMKCPRQHETAPTMKFCGECGTPLTANPSGPPAPCGRMRSSSKCLTVASCHGGSSSCGVTNLGSTSTYARATREMPG